MPGEGETIFELRKEPLHLASAVDGTVRELAEVIEKGGCAFELSVPDDMFLDADARALRQIFHILLGHALRLCKKGSPVSVSAWRAGTDTIVEITSGRLRKQGVDELDKMEAQLVSALVLAHGARLSIRQQGDSGRRARLRFFATQAAH